MNMNNKRRTFLAVILGLASIGLAATAFVKFFPRLMMKMMQRCMEQMSKEGTEPPEFCKKMMEKCCKQKPIKRKKK